MHIIIKGDSGRFKPHFNRALGKKYYCASDYLHDVKKAGLEPVKDDGIEHKFKKKSYSGVSAEARQMMNSVTYDQNGKPNIGNRYIDKLKSMGMKAMPKEIATKSIGGWC